MGHGDVPPGQQVHGAAGVPVPGGAPYPPQQPTGVTAPGEVVGGLW